MISLLRNDEREFFNEWWTCWRSLNVCILAQTPPSMRQRNPLYLPQVEGDRVLTRTQITGIHSKNGVTVRNESWLAGSLGGSAIMRLCILLRSSLLPAALPLLQPAHAQRYSNTSIPTCLPISSFNFPLPPLEVHTSPMSHTDHRLRAGYLVTQSPLWSSSSACVKWHGTRVNPSARARAQGRTIKSTFLLLYYVTWSLTRW